METLFDNDSPLMHQLLQGQPTAQTSFVEQYLPKVTRYVRQQFSSLHGDAEDVALDALYTVIEDISKFDPERGNLTNWVFQQARWRATDVLRATTRKQPTPIQTNHAPLTASSGSLDEARQRMERLSEEELELLELYFVDGHSYRSIAEMVGCSHTLVSRKIHATLGKLSTR